MYFYNQIMIIPLIIGLLLLTFANSITNFAVKREPPGSIMHIKIIRNIFILWMLRAMGIAGIVLSFQAAKDNPSADIMNKDENKITLLEKGELTEGTIVKTWYGKWAPVGWRVLYQFIAQNPETGEKEMCWGGEVGPKAYYSELSLGDKITVIYYPANPKINSEISSFLNHPSHRYVFKKAGILHLVDKYKDKCEVKDYGLTEWYDSQAEK